ncbi:YchJ family metal-binding protein [Nonomuraea sp. 10N515B]|uniref:YchJ family metal-binding protein n=1 Tax=Nonomuraea sp. 10N515B TaxID=3457422 RepID=UPI003FCCEBC8
MAWPYYESHGLVPFARALFALTLGVALGAVTRHTRIAMPLSVLLVGISQLAGRALRGHLEQPYWPTQTEGTVRFRAHYVDRGRPGEMEEDSRFVRLDGRWVYAGAV